MASWKLNVINSKFVSENSFEEGFPCDNPGLAGLSYQSYSNIFQASRTQL